MLCLTQARMTSARLPGKVLMSLAGDPLLVWVIKRLRSTKAISEIVVLTSEDTSDDILVDFCSAQAIPCHRGPLNNVAKRFLQTVLDVGASEFIRINGDSPLIDPVIVDRAIDLYQSNQCDLVTNVLSRSFPKGQSVEILRSSTFRSVYEDLNDKKDQEHITRAYYKNPERYRIVEFSSGIDAGMEQLAVDTREDFEIVRQLIDASSGHPGGWKDLLALKRSLKL